MGTQSKIGNCNLRSGRFSRWTRRGRRAQWKMRVRGVPTTKGFDQRGRVVYSTIPTREPHEPGRSKYEPHVGMKEINRGKPPL
jgi:hypothetical protein